MRLGINLLKCHRFTAITIEHTLRRFIVYMDNLRFGHIRDLVTLFLRPLRPRQILQASQCFIVGVLLPQAFPDGSIGIIAEGRLLTKLAGFSENAKVQ